MGLTSWPTDQPRPRKADVGITKNYLTAAEIDQLNRIVAIYLDFAELQAINRRAMTMQEWLTKLDQFLRLSERDIMAHAGRISYDAALRHAEDEYDKFRLSHRDDPSPVERHFFDAVQKIERLKPPTGKRKPKTGDAP